MSLIQEALRRKQEDAGDVPVQPTTEEADAPIQPESPKIPPPPPPPPPSATDSRPRQRRKRGRKWPAVLGLVLLLSGLAVGGAWMLQFYLDFQGTRPGPANGSENGPESPAPPEPTPENTGTPGSQDDLPTPPEPEPVQPPEPEPVQPPEADPVTWPKIKFSSMVGRGATGAVILDGEIVDVGEIYKGIEVVELDYPEVVLRYKGEVQRVKAGRSTKEQVSNE